MIEEEAEPEDEETKIEHQIMELQAAASTEKKQWVPSPILKALLFSALKSVWLSPLRFKLM